jgi:hypothetical protein
MKVAINCDWGGFGISDAAFEKLLTRKGVEFEKVVDTKYKSFNVTHYYKKGMVDSDDGYLSPYDYTRDRSDSDLIAVIEEMGKAANGNCADIKIIEIPDGIEWEVHEYDGMEHIAEKHRTWS